MDIQEKLAMICDYIKCELERDEEEMRDHIRDELQYDSVLTHDGELDEPDPAELAAAVEAKLYDISGMEIDTEAGIGFIYGQMFAMSDLRHFIGLLDSDPAEAQLLYRIKRGDYAAG